MGINLSRHKISAAIRALHFTLFLCLCIIAPAAFAQDNWLGGMGNWSNGAKWSAGVPGSGSNVFIDHGNGAASPVTLDVGGQANTLTIDSDDSLSFSNNTNLTINGNSISNSGTISLNSLGNFTYLFIANGATLSGTGIVTMSNNPQNQIDGNSGATLINTSTIQGAGQIGDHFTLANQGTINANVNGATLAVTQDTNATETNSSILEATNGGILQLRTSGSGAINNAGGTIKAVGTNSQVLLQAAVTGGTLTTSTGGTIVQPVSTSSTLTNLTNSGTFSVLNNGTVNLSGTITNTGRFQLNSTGTFTELFVPSAATLTGSGTVTMLNNSQNQVDGNGGATLTNQSTIQGVGQVGPHFALANQGTINANVNGAALQVNSESGATDTNTGTMEATNDGILQIGTDGSGSINNTGGVIEAVGANSQVQLYLSGTTITGGTLTTSAGGTIVVPAGTGVNLNGVTNAGTFSILNGGNVNLLANLTNNGTINVKSTGGFTDLFLPSVNVTLTGKGRVMMANTPFSIIDGNGGLLFTNQSTIQGGGQIGPHFAFLNKGTVHVNPANTMNIDAPFSNFSGSTLTGGTYFVAGSLQFTNADIVTNSANITLSGTTSQIVDQNSVNALSSFATNASAGSFTVNAGRQFSTTLSGDFSNAGKVTAATNSGFKVSCNPSFVCSYVQTAGTTTVDGVLTIAVGNLSLNGGKLFGTGTIAASVNSKASVTVGDTLTKAGKLSVSAYTQLSTGSLNIQIGGTTVGTQYSQLAVANGASLNGILNVKLINGFVPAIGDVYTILNSSVRTGTFSIVHLPTLSGAHFQVNYSATSVTLTVVSG